MANRYGFFRILPPEPNGTFETNAYRAELQSLKIAYNSVIPSDENGIPLNPWAFCVFVEQKFDQVVQLTNSYVFPDSSLDHFLSSIGTDPNDPNDILFAMRQALTARGLNDSAVQLHAKYRDVLFNVLNQSGGTFANIDQFSIG